MVLEVMIARIVLLGVLLCGVLATNNGWDRRNRKKSQKHDALDMISVPFYPWNTTREGYDMVECQLERDNEDLFLCREIIEYCYRQFMDAKMHFELPQDAWRVYSQSKARFLVLDGDCSSIYNGDELDFGQYKEDETDGNITVRIVKANDQGFFHELTTCDIRNTFAAQKCWQIIKKCNITVKGPHQIHPYRVDDDESLHLNELHYMDTCRDVYVGNNVIFTNVGMLAEKITVIFCPLHKRCKTPKTIKYNVASTPLTIFRTHFPHETLPDTELRVYMSYYSQNKPQALSVACPLNSLFRVKNTDHTNGNRYVMEFIEMPPNANDVDIQTD